MMQNKSFRWPAIGAIALALVVILVSSFLAGSQITPFWTLLGTIVTGLLTLTGVYVMASPAIAKVRSEINKINSEADNNNVRTASELQDMMKALYEERIQNLEEAWKKDKEKITKLESTIIEQFSLILALLQVIKERKIALHPPLKERVELLIASSPLSNLFYSGDQND